MRVMALVKRILRQLVRDKRTIGLLIFAPILVLTMLYFVFNGEDYIPKIGLVDVPEMLVDQHRYGRSTTDSIQNRSRSE